MNTNVLLSSIFFIAASDVNGNFIMLYASILKTLFALICLQLIFYFNCCKLSYSDSFNVYFILTQWDSHNVIIIWTLYIIYTLYNNHNTHLILILITVIFYFNNYLSILLVNPSLKYNNNSLCKIMSTLCNEKLTYCHLHCYPCIKLHTVRFVTSFFLYS